MSCDSEDGYWGDAADSKKCQRLQANHQKPRQRHGRASRVQANAARRPSKVVLHIVVFNFSNFKYKFQKRSSTQSPAEERKALICEILSNEGSFEQQTF